MERDVLAGTNISKDFHEKNFWKRLAPNLHIQDDDLYKAVHRICDSEEYLDNCKEQINAEGYFELADFDRGFEIKEMANVVRVLTEKQIPLIFAFVYDEFWAIFYSLHPVLKNILDDHYCRLPDFWVWHIDPKTSESGWAPHRDKGVTALFEGGRPKSVTSWIPLTDATPLNGCMYVVPANRDPQYATPMENTKSFEFAFQDIRALPGKAGTAFIWNQNVLHWGARASPRAPQPRISIAMEFQTSLVPPMNGPLSNPAENLPFKTRLNLIAKQIIQYTHMYPVTAAMQKWAEGQLPKQKLKQAFGTSAPANKLGRNDPCDCGSGKKYKHCHGAP